MKKIVCLALAIMMLASVASMVYAAEVGGNWGRGTLVEYDAETTEEYTVTVPAKLAPGGAGKVVLEGSWASNRKVTVTAAPSVTLTNNINSDTKTLAVTFATIEQVGNNDTEITVEEDISVADISGALFGKWSGTFTYTVTPADVDEAQG